MSNQTQVKKLKKRSPQPEDYGQTTYVTPTYAPPIYPVYNPYKPPAHFTSQLESSDTAQQTVQPHFASPAQTPVQLASPVQPTVLFNSPFQTPIRFPSPVQAPVQTPVQTPIIP